MRRTTKIVCKGGLNTSSPDYEVLPGQVIHAENVEQGIRGGYRRIDGYERFDGRVVPSEVSYWQVACSPLTTTLPESAKVIIGGFTTLTTQSHSINDTFLFLASPDTLPVATPVLFLGVTVATTEAPITSRYDTGLGDMVLWDGAMSKWRDLIRPVPGSGPIRGVAMREGEVVAFRDNLAGTEAEGFKATGEFLVVEKQTLHTLEFMASGFGGGVSVSENNMYATVGASKDTTQGADAGAALVYVLKGAVWVLQASLYASDASDNDRFGQAVSISSDGSTLVVGANQKSSGRGAAYVFTRSGTVWTEQAILYASDAEVNDNFGYSTAISSDGDTVAIGAYREGTGGSIAGATYVFTRSGTVWTEQAIIYASNANTYDFFGLSISISSDGGTLAVGAVGDDTGGSNVGATYVFTRSGTVWTEQAILYASDAEAADDFGRSVSISSDGSILAVGAQGEDTGGSNAGAAYVFTRSGTVWTEQAILYASDAEAADDFGFSVSISSDGSTLAVGAPKEDTGGSNAGAAYVFTRSGTVWTEQAILYASDALAEDQFGYFLEVSSDGTMLLVGTSSSISDKAYFYKISNGWESITELSYLEQQKLVPEYLSQQDFFGESTSIDGAGRNLAVGAPKYEDTALDAGLVQTYERYGENWVESNKLLPPGIQEEARFGTSVSLSEDGKKLIVGAPRTIGDGTKFTQKQKLLSSKASGGDGFGIDLEVSGDSNTLIVGARFEDTGASGSGSAFVFIRSGTTWSEQGELVPSDGLASDWAGTSVSISEDGNTAVLGAPGRDEGGSNRGAAYVFVRSGVTWSQQTKLLPTIPSSDSDSFGTTVEITPDGGTVFVGATFEGGADEGAVYVFVRVGISWSQQAVLRASDLAASDRFGTSVAASKDNARVIIGTDNSESVYVFVFNGNIWEEEGILVASDTSTSDEFGVSLGVSSNGDTAVIGAANEDGAGTNRGAAYVFVRNGSVWTEQQKIVSPIPEDNAFFGSMVDIDSIGETILITAPSEDLGGTNIGATYVFSKDGTTWTQQDKLVSSSPSDSDTFGRSAGIASNGKTVVVGTTQDDDGGSNAGAAYIFSTQRKDKGSTEYYSKGELGWGHVETITLANDLDSDRFGEKVVISDDGMTMIVGAPYKTKNGLANSGHAYVYELEGTWQFRSAISLDVPATNDYFGFSLDVSKDGGLLIIGQYGKTVSGSVGAGSVSLYKRDRGTWNLAQVTDCPDPEINGNFGFEVKISALGGVVAVAAPNEDALSTDDGKAYLYDVISDALVFKQSVILDGSNTAGTEFNFGLSLDLDETGDTLFVSQGGTAETGKLNIFLRNGDIWTPVFRKPSSDNNSLSFGKSISVSPRGDYISCGAPASITNTGQAFVFVKNGAALAPGGDYFFDNYNFIGPSQSKNLYGADGVNLGFEYTGNLFRQIRTGADEDTPRHVIAHRQYLFFSFGPSMQHSSISDPHEWQIATGAAELGIGDEITGFSRLSGGELAIFGRNETDVLYGSSTLDWVLAEFSKTTGAYRGSIQSLGVPMYLDDRGVVALTTTIQERGNFSRTTISEIVQSVVDELKSRVVASTIVRSKNQYRIFFTGGVGLLFTLSSESEISILPIRYSDTVRKAVSQESAAGVEQLYFGSDSGYVFKVDSGISFDGASFKSEFRLANTGLEYDQYKKRYFKGEVLLLAEGYTDFSITPDLDYGTEDVQGSLPSQFILQDPGGFFLSQGIGLNKTSRVRTDIKGVARTISLIFSSESKLIYPYTVNSVVLDWAFRKRVN